MPEYQPNLTIDEILNIEGIVIRKIPVKTRTNWSDGTSEVKDNSLGGKYFVTLKHNQDSTVKFNKDRDGIGDTVQEAWRDLMLNLSYYIP
jgi:hypothetical protein